jgi:predicted adenine nucleotide alpha hydrolase (AANH) superfamily ATPase
MLSNGIRPTLFFYNPNIFPHEEYDRRKAEAVRHAERLGLEFIDGDYNHAIWLDEVKGFEGEPERGARCLQCFRHRLTVAARYAHENGFNVFASTLATSRWKSLEQIALAGKYAASLFKGLTFLAQNWRKGGLTERRNELVQQYGFYNQKYCGCEFSLNNARIV